VLALLFRALPRAHTCRRRNVRCLASLAQIARPKDYVVNFPLNQEAFVDLAPPVLQVCCGGEHTGLLIRVRALLVFLTQACH
jgi:hypothetical protein